MPNNDITIEVEMRSQKFTEHKPVDLNCGRYCAEAAVKAAIIKHSLTAPGDIFHDFLSVPSSSWGVAWSPKKEGKAIFSSLPVPDDADTWKLNLKNFGPMVVGIVFLKLFGHFVLVVGCVGDTIQYRDPLDHKVLKTEDRTSFTKKINDQSVSMVSYSALKQALQAVWTSPEASSWTHLP